MKRAAIFRQLVRHFFDRFFDKESLSPQGQPEAGMVQTLGMLATPAAFVSILALPLSFERWDLVAFRFLFQTYSMVAMGVVMVFEWDALFPDRRDYQILTPLPLGAFTLLAAKMAALGIFLGIFLGAANFFGVLFWPSVEGRGDFLPVAGTHLAVMASAGLFAALAIAAFQGVLRTVLPGAAYRRVSVWAQTGVMAGLIMLLFVSPLMGSAIGELCRENSAALRWFPGFWFAGLYEQMRPAVGRAASGSVLAGVGPMAVRGIWVALGVFLLTFLPGYRRHARRVLEAPEPSPKGPGRLARMAGGAVDRWLKDPVECGVFHFIGQTLARSLKHRLFLATYGGLGAALVAIGLASGGSSRRVPLTLTFMLVSGLRAAFNFPSDLRANWAFQVSETSSVAAYVRATRKWVMVCAVLPVAAVLAGIEAARGPWGAAAFHFAFVAAASAVLMEALFLDFRKAPFTCSHFPGKVNLVLLSVLYVFGFTFYSSYMARLEGWLWSEPAAAGAFFVAVGASLWALGRARERLVSVEAALDYEDDGDPAVCVLGLTE